jgi:hypothetical protein
MCKGTLCVCGGYLNPRVQVHTHACTVLNHYSTAYDGFTHGDLRYLILYAGVHVFNLCVLPDAGLSGTAWSEGMVKAGPCSIEPLLRASGLGAPGIPRQRKFPQVFMQLCSSVLSQNDLVIELESLAHLTRNAPIVDPRKDSLWNYERVCALFDTRGLLEYSRLLAGARAFTRGRYPQLFDDKEDHGR